MNTSIIVRKKNDPTAPLLTSTPESVDLDYFDVVDEHGRPVSEEELEEIRKLQEPPAPPAEKNNKPQQQHSQHQVPPQHQPQHQPAAAPKKSKA